MTRPCGQSCGKVFPVRFLPVPDIACPAGLPGAASLLGRGTFFAFGGVSRQRRAAGSRGGVRSLPRVLPVGLRPGFGPAGLSGRAA